MRPTSKTRYLKKAELSFEDRVALGDPPEEITLRELFRRSFPDLPEAEDIYRLTTEKLVGAKSEHRALTATEAVRAALHELGGDRRSWEALTEFKRMVFEAIVASDLAIADRQPIRVGGTEFAKLSRGDRTELVGSGPAGFAREDLRIRRSDYRRWLELAGENLPAFWFPSEPTNSSGPRTKGTGTVPRYKTAREFALHVAQNSWLEDVPSEGPEKISRLAHMVNYIHGLISSDLNRFSLHTPPSKPAIRKWSKPLAPPEASKAGRPQTQEAAAGKNAS